MQSYFNRASQSWRNRSYEGDLVTIGKNTLAALKRYYKKPLEPIDNQAVLNDLKTESDRAAVIIMGSILEDSLAYAITVGLKMRKCKDQQDLEKLYERVFGFNGPIGSFSEKITVAFAFQVIEQETSDQLTIIREMRNACAHSQEPMSFSTPEMAAYCLNLFAKDNDPFVEWTNDTNDLRQAFLAEAMFLSMVLTNGSRANARRAYELHFAGIPSVRTQT
jgi:hypothetical protein